MKKFYCFVSILLGTGSHVQADCADGIVTCQLTGGGQLPDEKNPPYEVGFGCKGNGILSPLWNIGPCYPIPEDLEVAKNICEKYYGGVDNIRGCNVDWESVFDDVGHHIKAVNNLYDAAKILGSVVGL